MKFLQTLLCFVSLAIVTAFTVNKIGNKGYKIGDIAEDFSLKNTDGSMVSLADYKDAKGFIIVFTCNECPIC